MLTQTAALKIQKKNEPNVTMIEQYAATTVIVLWNKALVAASDGILCILIKKEFSFTTFVELFGLRHSIAECRVQDQVVLSYHRRKLCPKTEFICLA